MNFRKLTALILSAAIFAACFPLSMSAAGSGFSDVTTAHWSYIYVTRAAQAGVVSGMGDGTFRPDDMLTAAQFVSIIVRACGIKPDEAASGQPWHAGYMSAAENAGLLKNVHITDPDLGITRYAMAEIVYAALMYLGCEPLTAGETSDTLAVIPDEIPDARVTAVTGVYAFGIISGADIYGSFLGDAPTTRAQGAVIYCRMISAVESRVSIGGNVYRVGMSSDSLTKKAGVPDETLTGITGLEWRVYVNGYAPFFAAAVSGGRVAALLCVGGGFVYSDMKPGDRDVSVSSRFVTLLTDQNDDGLLYGVYVAGGEYTPLTGDSHIPDALYGEARLNFHMINAFRLTHGLNVLEWSDIAAEAGRLHCADMAANGYFAHEGLNGSTPSDRIKAAGLESYRAVGENIYSNTLATGGGIDAFRHLVNSASHRETMLYPDFDHAGVACVLSQDGAIYLAEEFYK